MSSHNPRNGGTDYHEENGDSSGGDKNNGVQADCIEQEVHVLDVSNDGCDNVEPHTGMVFHRGSKALLCKFWSTDKLFRLRPTQKVNCPAAKNYNSVVVEAGGYNKMAFTQQDCKNSLLKERCLQLGTSDGVAVHEFLTESMRNDKDFFYLMDLDEESRVCSILWVDARARAAYESFGDVVTFDTTYRTNKYGIPFAPFVGVNHHGSSILLGCGLLANEKVEGAWDVGPGLCKG
ncbi:FAR1-related protein [Corchorus capsularis]|uniref:FAR1-related protein n=1 Tax=Corchorus capsularis TaxID=210143 RepID=A0A1R3GPU2_COCAP|nr:FAR1-related protein [Corchorus capsularis]